MQTNLNTKKCQRVVLQNGFGFPRYGVDESDAPPFDEVEDCKGWLLRYAKKKRRPKGECLNSYYLKELVERAAGHYTSNGALIQAGIELGFEYYRWTECFFPLRAKAPRRRVEAREAGGLLKMALQARHTLR